MPQILVRDLDDATVDRLKARAQAGGRSLQAEVKMILEEAARRRRPADAWAAVDALREKLTASGRTFGDSADLVREDRDR